MTGFLTIFTGPSHRPDFAQNPSQSRHGDGAARFERSLWRAGTGWDGFAAAARAATSGKGWTLHDSGGMATLFGDSYAVNGACLTLWPGLRLWQAGNRPGLGGTVWRADVWAHSGVLLSLPGRTAWPMLVRRALTGGTGYGGPAPPALEGRFGGQADGSMAALSCRCPVELPGRCWSGGALAGALVMVGRHLQPWWEVLEGRRVGAWRCSPVTVRSNCLADVGQAGPWSGRNAGYPMANGKVMGLRSGKSGP